MAPPISLIMTVYNREQYLGAAIQSVLAQTQPNFELLIWDDGSTDNSLSIAQHFAQQDSRIKLIAYEHQGRVLSLKAAHAEVKSDYLGWVDSDDLLAPTALAETTPILDAYSHIGLVYTDYLVIDENNKTKGLGSRCRIPYSKDRMLIDFMTFHFRLFRRDIFEQAGGIDPYFQAAIDYDLCLRLAEVTEFQHLEKPLYYYRSHSQSISQASQLQQIYYSREAINFALRRRELAGQYRIEVQESRFFLLKKKQKLNIESDLYYGNLM